MNLNEAKASIKRAGILNVRVVPMKGQPFDGDHQIDVRSSGDWITVASGLTKSMGESLVREATSRVIMG